jgi:putative effector of murein hydrolase
LTARLAARHPMAHCLALGCVGFVIGTAGAIATWDEWTSWYSLAIIAVTLPCSWLGARIYMKRPTN